VGLAGIGRCRQVGQGSRAGEVWGVWSVTNPPRLPPQLTRRAYTGRPPRPSWRSDRPDPP